MALRFTTSHRGLSDKFRFVAFLAVYRIFELFKIVWLPLLQFRLILELSFGNGNML